MAIPCEAWTVGLSVQHPSAWLEWTQLQLSPASTAQHSFCRQVEINCSGVPCLALSWPGPGMWHLLDMGGEENRVLRILPAHRALPSHSHS